MEVAHSSGAFPQVWLLEKNGGREFAVAGLYVGASLFKEKSLVPVDAVLTEALGKLPVKGFVPAKFPVIEEGGSGNWIASSFRYAFGNGPGGVADLEPEVKKRVEDIADQFLLFGVEIVRGLGEQKEKVYVGPGIEESPSVAAIGDQSE